MSYKEKNNDKKEMVLLLQEYFNLKMKIYGGKEKRTHLLRVLRRKIAQLKEKTKT